jgi:hypothetical protein
VVITTRYRPVKGSRGYHRTNFRHGVSPLLSGERYTLESFSTTRHEIALEREPHFVGRPKSQLLV